MAVSVEISLPQVNAAQYEQLLGQVGAALSANIGLLAHAGAPAADGWKIVELWSSEAQWARFAQEVIAPLAKSFGVEPRPPRIEALHRLIMQRDPRASLDALDTSHVAPVGKDEGARLGLGPLEILIKEDGRGTRQTLAVAEFRGRGFRIPIHTHTEHDESIYVLEGTMGVLLGEQSFQAAAGTSFTIPIGVRHSVWNESEQPVRFLNTIVPARYLSYFHELSMAAAATPGAMPPREQVQRIMRSYGLQPELAGASAR